MEHKRVTDITDFVSFPECRHHQFNIRPGRYIPAYYFPGKQINYNTEIEPLSVCFYVSKVTGPDKVWCLLVELLFQMVMAYAVIRIFSTLKRLAGGHFGKFHAAHQPVHSANADADAIIAPEDVRNLVCPKTFVIVRIDLKNDSLNVLVLLNSGGKILAEMLVISAPVYIEYTAKRFNVMLKPQLMNCIQPFSECGVKMAIAFFNIRFSSSSWAIRFCISLIC